MISIYVTWRGTVTSQTKPLQTAAQLPVQVSVRGEDKQTEMSSGFVTEAELEERKRVRQEEWERVRKPSDPVAVPEEQIDNR